MQCRDNRAKRRKSETRSTATEHAETEKATTPPWRVARSSASSSAQGTRHRDNHGTATEHATQRSFQEEAQADRAQSDMVHLAFKLAEFLVHLMRKLYCSSRVQFECEDIVFDKISQWAQKFDSTLLYGEDELKLHQKMWEVMTQDKDGKPKEHNYDVWCRRIAAAATSADSSAATEHADHTSAYRNLARDVFALELTPTQKNNPEYKLREGKSVTTKLRSLINVLLRKNLGDARVASYIFEHGVPGFLNPPICSKPLTQTLLQSMLEEFMTWHALLLHWLLKQQQHPFTSTAQKLSALDQREWQNERRRLKAEARERLKEGEHLVTLRDKGKRKFEDMSATEQQVVEDFECGKLKRRHDQLRIQKPDRFRDTMP